MKKRTLLLGATAVLALGVAATVYADPPPPGAPRVDVRVERHGPMMDIDANHDGFISRAEAQAAAEKMFDEMDENHDGKLDTADHGGRMERRVVIRREVRDGDGAPKAGERREVEEETVIEHGDGHEHREVIVRREGGDEDHGGHDRHGGRHGMHGPMHGPPMGMMIFMHSEEADLNHDGAMQKSEFVTQHLRFFDAADVNGDGKIKFDPPPMPPMPPMPPQPPAPGAAPGAPQPPQPPIPPAPPRR